VASKRRIKPFGFFFNTKGLDEYTGTMFIQPDAAVQIENMHVDAIGQWSAYKQGYDNFTAQLESGARVDSLGWYTDASGTDYLLEAINGKIKNINTSTGAVTSEISTGFTGGNPVDFETFKGTLYAVEKSISPQKWAGSGSMSAASGWPVTSGSDSYDKPSLVEAYANRLTFANFNGATKYPSHIVISDNLAPETFTLGASATDGAVIQVNPGDGQNLVAMRNLYIPNQDTNVLILFKDRSVYSLSGTTPSTFVVTRISSKFGALNNRCVVQVGQDLLFLDVYNINSLSTATESGTIQPKAIGSERVIDTLATLNLSAKDKAWAIHYPDRREVWFAIPTGSNTEPDTIIVYYYNQTDQGPVNMWSIRKGTTETCALLLNKTVFTGSSTGYIRKWFNSSKYGSTGISWIYKYPFFNFGTQYQNKRVLECYAWFLLIGSETITFKTEWRGGGNNIQKTISKTISITDGSGSVYGTVTPPAAVFGTSVYGGSAILKKIKIPVIGNGEQLQFTVTGTTGSTGPIFLGLSGLVEYMEFSRSYK